MAPTTRRNLRLLRTVPLLGLLGVVLARAAESPHPAQSSAAPPSEPDEAIDLFTGDFRYAVPLLTVPGPRGDFPLTLSYQSGVSPDQEASWVGLGWTLNVGSISRQLRGLPDDFAGERPCATAADLDGHDCVAITEDIQPNWTFSLGTEAAVELFGADSSVGLGLSAGFKGYFNSYRGLGYERSIGLSGQSKASGISGAAGLNLSLDSQSGLRAAPSLSLADTLNANASLDAVNGLSALSVGARHRNHDVVDADLSSFLGFARGTVIPGPGRDMTGWNIAVSVKGGGEIQGVYLNLKAAGSYNIEQVKTTAERYARAVGYLHLDRALTESDVDVRDRLVLDFNREHDGPIYDDSPNLAVPVLTQDVFALSGPGLAGTFRAYRNDVPWVYDPLQTTELLGGAVGFDVGGGLVAKFGVSGSLNGTKGRVGGWDGGNGGALVEALKGVAPAARPAEWERYYWKLIGETVARAPAAALPGGDAPVAAPLQPAGFDLTKLPPDYFQVEPALSRGGADRIPITLDQTGRAPRATLIESFTNGQLDRQAAAFPEFQHARSQLFDERRPHHVGGFRVTSPGGTRSVYGIPVYAADHEEHEFSVKRDGFAPGARCALVLPPITGAGASRAYAYAVDGTEQYRHVKRLSPYPVAWLLTAVLGPDYVDADGRPGPTDGDTGYWVRFDYRKVPGLLGWRRPFYGASFVRGHDNGAYVLGKQRLADKGVYSYGRREEWYLSEIHTASHVARVRLAARTEGHGARESATNGPFDVGRATQRLDSIELLAKDRTRPASSWTATQTVHFAYDTSLQRGAPGATAAGVGRLTLKKVWTTFGADGRGARSPYTFDYGEADPAANPPFAWNAAERWGSYQPGAAALGPNACATAGGPVDPTLTVSSRYTIQDRAARDRDAAAWSLRSIVEPTGRRIGIEYESDDYAYVQDRPATVMVKLAAVGDPAGGTPDVVDPRSHAATPAPESLRVHFPVAAGTAAASVLPTYVGPSKRLYFRVRVALKDGVADPAAGAWETVSGYANVTAGGTVPGPNGGTLGWLALEPVQGFHPFTVAAFQHLRLVQPELMSTSAINGAPGADPFSEALKVLTMVDFLEEIVALARGAYQTWFDRGWGQRLDLEHSWIRLRTAGGAKLGGGARVKRLTYDDRWAAVTGNAEASLVTGYTYDYRLPDGTSSGVAAYEPEVGAEENAVRDAKPFTQQVLLASSYNLYAQTPLLESDYPAPAVGYARVTIRTVASERARDRGRQGRPPSATSTVGPVVHEFYTARDFPVVTAETAIKKVRNPQPWIVPIPFLGQITLNSLAASQGYAVTLNDMHGKSRRETHYEYGAGWDPAAQDFPVRAKATRSTEWRYRATGGAGGTPFALTAALPVLHGDAARTSPDVAYAREAELVVDTRRSRTESWEAGLNVNVDLTYAVFPIPIVVPIPNMSYALTEAKTVVTAKVIHQAGMLDSIVSTLGPTRTVEQRLLFDAADGRPLLTTRTNDFGDPVFEYHLPGHWYYPRLGPAYRSAGLELPLTGAQLVGTRELRLASPALPACPEAHGPRTAPCLPLGSTFAADAGTGTVRLRLVGSDATGLLLRASASISAAPSGPARLVATGDANRLDLEAGAIRALSDPTSGRSDATCRWKTRDACGVCSTTTVVVEPSCGARLALDRIAELLPGGRGASRSCPGGGDTFGKIAATGAGTIPGLRATSAAGRVCRILLVDERGNELDPRTVTSPGALRIVELPPAPTAGGLAYTGLALGARVAGRPATVLVYSDCDGWTTERQVTTPSVSYCDTPHEARRTLVSDVLSAEATVFRDDWPSVEADMRFAGSAAQIRAAEQGYRDADAFSRGVAGIWRPWRVYRYVEDRKQSAEVDVRRDGTFTLRAFDWADAANERCAPQWRWKSQITRYGAHGVAHEEVSPIGVSSASLYGFGRKVPVAIARNAQVGEILAEGFEQYPVGSPGVAPEQTGEGHFTFHTVRVAAGSSDQRCGPDVLLRGWIEDDVIVIEDDAPAVRGAANELEDALRRWGRGDRGGALLVDLPGQPCPVRVARVEEDPEGRILLVLDRTARTCGGRLGAKNPPASRQRAQAFRLLVECGGLRPPPRVTRIDVSSARAHTGKQSLSVNAHVDFPQPELRLVPGKRYVVSGWVSRQGTDAPTFADVPSLGIQVKLWAGAGELGAARPPLARPTGPVIAGWQRIEGIFALPPEARSISIALQNGADRGAGRAYFDDLRIVPEDAELEALVYEPGTLRNVARLDPNNYAVLYGYHADGSLAQTQQETVHGLLTTIEERHHAEERP